MFSQLWVKQYLDFCHPKLPIFVPFLVLAVLCYARLPSLCQVSDEYYKRMPLDDQIPGQDLKDKLDCKTNFWQSEMVTGWLGQVLQVLTRPVFQQIVNNLVFVVTLAPTLLHPYIKVMVGDDVSG